MKTKTDFPNKPFEMLTSLLSIKRKKEKQPNSDEIQIQKAASTILSQILTHSSPELASELLSLIGMLIYTTLSLFINLKQPLVKIKQFKGRFKKTQGRDMFTIAPQTLKSYTDTIRPELSDQFLHDQVSKLSQKSDKLGLTRKENSLATDPTTKEYKGKYPNQNQPKGYVGQKERFPTAYSEQTTCDCTNEYILSSKPKKKTNNKYKSKKWPEWILRMKEEIMENISQNKWPKVIYGDREFFQALPFALATLNWHISSISPDKSPRFVVPKKVFDKDQTKLEFLLDPMSNEIKPDIIELQYYHWGLLGNALNQFAVNKKKTKYKIPIAKVATFDAYSNRKKKKNLNYAKKKAQGYHFQLEQIKQNLNEAIENYDQFRKMHKTNYKKKRTNFGGRGKVKFKNPTEKPLYDRCRKNWNRKKKLEKKIRNLTKRLMFFAVSIRPNEDVIANSEELISLCRGYHQRWMIENAFKSIKGQFWIPTKKRSLQARHTYFIISALLYNAWHYKRISRFKRKSQYSAAEIRSIKSWQKTKDTRKAQEMMRVLSARGFLFQTLAFGLKSLLKSQILA